MKPVSVSSVSQQLFQRPYVISWNLTYRCNLACEHCYLDAGWKPRVRTPEFADRRELDTQQCKKIIDDIVDFAPECVTILTGGEPLLRRDILEIIQYGHQRALWMVVGTNGVLITESLAIRLKEEGVRGLALSLDSVDPQRHDAFRRVRGAWENTVNGAALLNQVELPFIVQTTVARLNLNELEEIAEFACSELEARVWNLYFLVPSGRGQFTSDLEPEEYDRVLAALRRIQKNYKGRMLVNAKCAPHYTRYLFERDPESPFLKVFQGGAGGCPAGTQYMGIRPNGDVTPCPYLPVFGGNLRTDSLSAIWKGSTVFQQIRQRKVLGGRCGECEFSSYCGGCRARAYGMTGDFMAEDALCSYEPGQFSNVEEKLNPSLRYGESASPSLGWDDEARQRIQKVPAFVRGMVIRRVEDYCRSEGLNRVTVAALEEIRSRMPTGKIFRR